MRHTSEQMPRLLRCDLKNDRTAIFRPSARGFTLIEVLAALVIIGLGMLAVIRAVNQTANNASYLRDKAYAHWVAMNVLTETRLSLTPPSNDTSDGDVEMANVTWHWRRTVTKMDDMIQRIEVKVAPKNQSTDSSMDTVFGLYGTSFQASTPTPGWDYNQGVPNGNQTTSSSSSSASSTQPLKPVPGPLN